MPALYTHLRFGEEVSKILDPAYQDLIKRYPEAFALGTQGPDILFYHHPTKSNDIRKRGSLLHQVSGNDFFLAQGEKLIQSANGGDILEANGAFASYTIGFLCHFTLDASCHFYVEKEACEAVSHARMESELDKYILRKDGKPIRGYNTATPITDANGARESVVKTLDISNEQVALAIKTMKKYNGWFSYQCEFFHNILPLLLKIAGIKRKFGDMFLHKKTPPQCEKHNEVLWETWQNAIPQAKTAIETYFGRLTEWVHSQYIHMELFRYNFGGIIKIKE